MANVDQLGRGTIRRARRVRRAVVFLASILVIATLVVAAVIIVRLHEPPGPVGNPDPGHRLMAAIEPVLSVVPAGAVLSMKQANEPQWDSCDGRRSTYGWDPVTVIAVFTGGGAPTQVVAHVDAGLRAMGWGRYTHPGDGEWYWTRALIGGSTATADLLGGPGADPPGWSLQVTAPAATHPVTAC